MGHFSVEISPPSGSLLSGNQQIRDRIKARNTDNALLPIGVAIMLIGIPIALFSYGRLTDGLNDLGSPFASYLTAEKIHGGALGVAVGSALANIGFFFALFGWSNYKIDSSRVAILDAVKAITPPAANSPSTGATSDA